MKVVPSSGVLRTLMEPSCSLTIFLATELTQGESAPMEDERIETRWFAKKELREQIASNRILDAKTMIGFLRWKRYLGGK